MKRRGFFGALVGLFLASMGLKAKEAEVAVRVPWRMVKTSWKFSLDPEEQAKLDDRAYWDRMVHLVRQESGWKVCGDPAIQAKLQAAVKANEARYQAIINSEEEWSRKGPPLSIVKK